VIKLLFLVLFLSGCGGKSKLIFDSSTTSERGRDLSLIFRGCDQGLSRGYLFCPLQDQTLIMKEIEIFLPRVDCSRRSCVDLQVLNPDGSFGYAISVARGNHSIVVPVKDIIQDSGTVRRLHDGEYRLLATVFYDDDEKIERSVRIEGVIRMWVRENRYRVLSCNSTQTAWRQKIDDQCFMDWTTAGRSALCGEC
jgi:hypothetical protein